MNPPNINNQIPDIDGNVLRVARENRRLTQEQLARILCLSPKHVHQLENNGSSAFFSLKHRYQVALKLASYLGLQPIDIWVDKRQLEPTPDSIELVAEQAVMGQLGEDLSVETVSVAQPSKAPSSQRMPFVSPMRYILCLVVAIPLGYWGIDWVMTQDHLGSVAPVAAIPDQIKKPLVDNDSLQTNPVDMCDFSRFTAIAAVSVELPLKKGDNLFVIGKSDQPVCVIDGMKKISTLNLTGESKQLVIGQAPFIIHARDFNGLEIYFQGRKVRYPNDWQGPMKLVESFVKEVAN